MTTTRLTSTIEAQALELGFSAVGFADVTKPWDASDQLRQFVAEGRHGEMAWMQETLDRRVEPRAMWPDARTAIVLGLNYGPKTDPLEILNHPDRAGISVYARGKDYHDVLKKRLKQLARWIAQTQGWQVKVFVDTAPLMEKPLAARAGLGWQGKHTNLVSREWGSWLFLGVILTEGVLQPDTPEPDHCGRCQACLDICPTQAFTSPYRMDARRCISYLTIELKGPIPVEFRKPMGNRIYGCDDCLAVCPWNKFAEISQEIGFRHRAELTAPHLADLAALDDPSFREVFSGSPIKRIGRDRFVRNVLYAIGNANDPALAQQAAVPLLQDDSLLVRSAAVWAVRQVLGDDVARQHSLPHEAAPEVLAEWS